MKKVKRNISEKVEEIKNKLDCYFKFKKARMARIKGSFMGGGFNISQNKLIAIFENEEQLKEFAKGKFDSKIDALEEDEVIEVE